jgi:hypothetical protein
MKSWTFQDDAMGDYCENVLWLCMASDPENCADNRTMASEGRMRWNRIIVWMLLGHPKGASGPDSVQMLQ